MFSEETKAIADLYQEMISEDLTAGGVLGGSVGTTNGIANTDFYATGDARIPKGSKVVDRNGVVKRKKKLKKKKNPDN